jgi:hypothetical protein
MPTRLNEAINVSRELLDSKGVFNGLVDFDSRLHIDPALIGVSGVREFNEGKETVIKYFTNVLRLIKASQKEGDVFWNTALKLISFGEGLNTALGYSSKGTGGSGIGKKAANDILVTIKAIQKAGTEDPEIFELVSLFEKDIGPDKISDMISIILRREFRAYTQRIANELRIKTKAFSFENEIFELPFNLSTNTPYIFVPRKILNDLPIAEDWEDVPIASAYSQGVKNSMNNLVGESWKQLSKINKAKLKELLIENPEFVNELLDLYKKRKREGYDFEVDHLGELIWDIVGLGPISENPLNLKVFGNITDKNILQIVESICKQYKKLIEENGLVEHIFDSNGKRRPERFAQLLLFAVADSYCNANNLDLSREPNAGSGALDFKISRGLKKVSTEVKYSSNPKLVEGFEKQLETYNRAESIKTSNSIYLVLRVNDKNDQKIKIIEKLILERNKKSMESPVLIVVDSIKKPSASKR